MRRARAVDPKPLLQKRPDWIADLEIELADGHPAVRSGWVWVEQPSRLCRRALRFTGPIHRIEREAGGRHKGRIVLWVLDSRRSQLRATCPEFCRSRKPPRRH